MESIQGFRETTPHPQGVSGHWVRSEIRLSRVGFSGPNKSVGYVDDRIGWRIATALRHGWSLVEPGLEKLGEASLSGAGLGGFELLRPFDRPSTFWVLPFAVGMARSLRNNEGTLSGRGLLTIPRVESD